MFGLDSACCVSGRNCKQDPTDVMSLVVLL